MSRLVITCGTFNPPDCSFERIRDFFESIRNSFQVVPEMKERMLVILVVMGEGHPEGLVNYWRSFVPNLVIEHTGINERRAARVVAMLRNNAIERHMEDDDIVCAFDDDYVFNPYAFKFVQMLFDENPDISFASVFKPWEQLKDVDQGLVVKKSGFTFWITSSVMGGCSIYRWSEFKKHIYDYFKEFNVQLESDNVVRHGSFDQTFFAYCGKRIGKPFIYHLMDFSLMQHVWHKSNWYEERGNRPLHHTWSDRFDPCFDPFLVKELLKQ